MIVSKEEAEGKYKYAKKKTEKGNEVSEEENGEWNMKYMKEKLKNEK